MSPSSHIYNIGDLLLLYRLVKFIQKNGIQTNYISIIPPSPNALHILLDEESRVALLMAINASCSLSLRPFYSSLPGLLCIITRHLIFRARSHTYIGRHHLFLDLMGADVHNSRVSFFI